MPVSVITNSYRNSHGSHPKGMGHWMFTIGDADYSFVGLYTSAKKDAQRYARTKGVQTIKLLP